jgi:hypothetical protein
MIHVDSDVPLVTDRQAPPTKPAMALEVGDVIAVPFAGYADILCEVTGIGDTNEELTTVTVTDGSMTYLHQIPFDASIVIYDASRVGEVLS